MDINRYDLLTAIINAQDNNDGEYYDLLAIYNNSFDNDINSLCLTETFFINDKKLLNYIKKICDIATNI